MSEPGRLLLIWMGSLSTLTFLLFAWDKLAAIAGRTRVPELALLGASLCGGAPGGLLGMLLLRHKIRNKHFRVALPLFLLLHGAAVLAAVL